MIRDGISNLDQAIAMTSYLIFTGPQARKGCRRQHVFLKHDGSLLHPLYSLRECATAIAIGYLIRPAAPHLHFFDPGSYALAEISHGASPLYNWPVGVAGYLASLTPMRSPDRARHWSHFAFLPCVALHCFFCFLILFRIFSPWATTSVNDEQCNTNLVAI